MGHAGESDHATSICHRHRAACGRLHRSLVEPERIGLGCHAHAAFGIIFAPWFVYDTTGKPIWYAATNGPVTATGCAGGLCRVDSGMPLTKAWNGAKPVATKVGDVTFTFGNAVTA